jgi:hypothetical protein
MDRWLSVTLPGSLQEAFDAFMAVLAEAEFTIVNPVTGQASSWNADGTPSNFDPETLRSRVASQKISNIHFWRGSGDAASDTYVGWAENAAGIEFRMTLVGLDETSVRRIVGDFAVLLSKELKSSYPEGDWMRIQFG